MDGSRRLIEDVAFAVFQNADKKIVEDNVQGSCTACFVLVDTHQVLLPIHLASRHLRRRSDKIWAKGRHFGVHVLE